MAWMDSQTIVTLYCVVVAPVVIAVGVYANATARAARRRHHERQR